MKIFISTKFTKIFFKHFKSLKISIYKTNFKNTQKFIANFIFDGILSVFRGINLTFLKLILWLKDIPIKSKIMFGEEIRKSKSCC